jgi:hypothetical protein
MIEYQRSFYLRGIVSSSIVDRTGSCTRSKYAVITDVLKYKSWIENPFEGGADSSGRNKGDFI